ARMRALLNSVADAIITFDAAGVIEEINPAAERVFGLSRAEALGLNVSTLLGEQVASGYANSAHDETTGWRHDGTPFPMDLAVSEMYFGERRISIASVRDATDRTQAEAAQRFLAEASK